MIDRVELDLLDQVQEVRKLDGDDSLRGEHDLHPADEIVELQPQPPVVAQAHRQGGGDEGARGPTRSAGHALRQRTMPRVDPRTNSSSAITSAQSRAVSSSCATAWSTVSAWR